MPMPMGDNDQMSLKPVSGWPWSQFIYETTIIVGYANNKKSYYLVVKSEIKRKSLIATKAVASDGNKFHCACIKRERLCGFLRVMKKWELFWWEGQNTFHSCVFIK